MSSIPSHANLSWTRKMIGIIACGEEDNSGKAEKMKARRQINLPTASTQVVFINWKTTRE